MSGQNEGRRDEKRTLRPLLRARRAALATGHAGRARSLRLQERLLGSSLWDGCSRVVLFCSLPEEPSTSLLLESAWSSGRELFLPYCHPERYGHMDMIHCRGKKELHFSRFGIAEPERKAGSRLLSRQEMQDAATLLVVPALAFDRKGFRLGMGGGYYDRFLCDARCPSVGLAFHELLLPALPCDPWDRPVQAVCTEEELLCTHV